MKFSIIIPVFNVEKYLNRCIESVLNQTYQDFEIILVDDGSSDNCPQICDDWAQKDNRIKVIHKKNEGVSAARNDGIDLSRGDYILFVDGDDYIDENLLRICYENLEEEYDILSFRFVRIGESGCKELGYPHQVGIWKLFSEEQKFDYLYNHIVVSMNGGWEIWRFCFKESLLKESNIYFPVGLNFSEDFAFVAKCVLKSRKTKQIDFKGYVYFQRNDSACHRLLDNPFKKINSVLCVVYDFALSNNLEFITENYYLIYSKVLETIWGTLINIHSYKTLKQVRQDLKYFKIDIYKKHSRTILKKYFKNLNKSRFKGLSRAKLIERTYWEALLKYSYSGNILHLYLIHFNLFLKLFFNSVKIKIKRLFNKKV